MPDPSETPSGSAAVATRSSTGKPSAPDFVYTIYITATPEQVWTGLIDRDMTKAYWGHYNVSDWTVGSRWDHIRSDDSGKIDTRGQIIEMDPPHKMVWSWALDAEADEPAKLSRVTFDLVALGPDTKLTITHSELEPGSDMDISVREGWPAVLSNLKSLLEAGKTLSDDQWP
ncbi:MAG: SRPBCC family protein [Parasphingorhabdus sp.]|uniref:SRPBCC family protein n=1 Tax=Parasphingorhabdus sp. TaxID=2709688 RepID=UPI00329805C2